MKLLKEVVELLKEPEQPKVEIGGVTYSVEPHGVGGYKMTNVENPFDTWTVGNLDAQILWDYAVAEPEDEQERDLEPER